MKFDALHRDYVSIHESQGRQAAREHLRETFRIPECKNDFSFKKLWYETLGKHEWYHLQDMGLSWQRITEAAGPMTTAHMEDTIGQWDFSIFMEKYNSPDFPFKDLFPAEQARDKYGMRVPKYTEVLGRLNVRPEGEAYEWGERATDYITTPELQDFGELVGITEEMVKSDRVGDVADLTTAHARKMGWEVEEQAVDCLIDQNRTKHRHRRRDNDPVASYVTAVAAATPYINQTDQNLVNFTDLDAAEQLKAAIKDPETGRPIDITLTHLAVSPARVNVARDILSQGIILRNTDSDAFRLQVANEWSQRYSLVSSQFLQDRTGNAAFWYLFNPRAYARRMEFMPVESRSLAGDALSLEGFTRRLALVNRVSACLGYCVFEPRASVKSTGAS